VYIFLDVLNGSSVRQSILDGLEESGAVGLNPTLGGGGSSESANEAPGFQQGTGNRDQVDRGNEDSFVDNSDVNEEVDDVDRQNEDQTVDRNEADADSNSEGNWLTYAELMMDSYPAKSKINYLKAFKSFERFLKSKKQFVPNAAPTEIQILNYFHYLKFEKNLAPTTLWSTYSRVNACVKRLYGFSLKNFVRVSDVLKSYESGYKVKKASIFTPQEVIIN